MNSSVLPQGLVLKINAMGIQNSLRNKKDGYVFFGSQEFSDSVMTINLFTITLKGFQNDYVIRTRDNYYEDENNRNK